MPTLHELVEMTNTFGQPHRQYVIIGEGNTSCRTDHDTFWIKASGQQMETINEGGFVEVHFQPVLDLLDNPPATQTEQKARIRSAVVNPDVKLLPSIEVSFHAMLLHECGVQVVGHTHPVAVNRILCSNRAEVFARKRIFPDEVVLCGPESVFVPYADPGLPLAIVMRERVREFMSRHGEAPKVILLASHGFIALGSTPREVLNITAMAVKAAEILAGAYSVGEPVFMDEEEVMHIYKRPDEIYRRNQFVHESK
jgi:rhamnose utilization protein RhaD (predicted bifunctional aldolase and dehydrogenase)